MDRSQYPVSILRKGEADKKEAPIPPEKALEMMWTLTLQSWIFKEKLDAEPRLQRHVENVKRK